uniref:Cyclin-D1-binding protein 1-like N-terminal domain-containing protein n=2 Tax=Attheya septentrionalis TaxID=420275 RepID=A0A7S2UAH1_9STRA|mmetsp:Transcript_16767/g.30472  ORF Transcript_16767/g.30472 Transcript_16767/m.30472 type:complete len:396 (+) Transcript_16767:149-1336(+)
MSGEDGQDANRKFLESLQRLAAMLKDLDEKSTKQQKQGVEPRGLPLSHWRELTSEVEGAYQMLTGGAALVHSTSTKYTLVGKIDSVEGAKLSGDLLKGCELVGTATLVIFDPNVGCGQSMRCFLKRSSRSIVATVINLVTSFVDGSALEEQVGAQKTGAVWSSCDAVAKVPKGNRNAMRRDLFTWVMECNETMEEFQEMIDLGPAPQQTDASNQDADGESWDDGDEDQYSDTELEVAKASLALIKCSRGTMSVVLKACECAGDEIVTSEGETLRKKAILQWMSDLHAMSRIVGEGATDLGALLYPPMNFSPTDEGDGEASDIFQATTLGRQIATQAAAIEAVNAFILDSSPTTEDGSSLESLNLSEDVTSMAAKLRTAGESRKQEAGEALSTTSN